MVLKCERRQDEVERLDCNRIVHDGDVCISGIVGQSYSMVVERRTDT